MLNKKLLMISGIVLCGLVVMGAYNRPYRWWNAIFSPFHIEDMNEQAFIKPFHPNSLRTPPEGSVALDAYDPVPNKMDLMMRPADFADLKNPITLDDVSIKKGEELYNVYCWPCHGTAMSPDEADWSPVRRGLLPGEVADQPRWSMPAANIELVRAANYSDEHIFSVISNGSAIMKRMDYHLSPEERWHVVNYVRSIANKNQ